MGSNNIQYEVAGVMKSVARTAKREQIVGNIATLAESDIMSMASYTMPQIKLRRDRCQEATVAPSFTPRGTGARASCGSQMHSFGSTSVVKRHAVAPTIHHEFDASAINKAGISCCRWCRRGLLHPGKKGPTSSNQRKLRQGLLEFSARSIYGHRYCEVGV